MDGWEVKEVMEQVHISPQMQEEIMMNIQKRMKNGNKKAGNMKKMGTVAAVFVLAAGVASLPVQAFVTNVVKARMEALPKEEVQDIADMIQEQEIAGDSYTREYSGKEKERYEELWQAYKNGTFPEKAVLQVDNEDAVEEGKLCYIRDTGVFHLPEEEMTDEELLEIIDFQNKEDYALAQTPAAQQARAEYQAEEARMKKIVRDANGISGEEAVEIAGKQLKADLGEQADDLELMTDRSGNGASLMELSGEFESRADVVYDVGFGDGKSFTYGYIIDAVDGRILYTWK